MKKGRTMELVNIPGTVRAIDQGNGICELMPPEPSVLCVIPVRKKSRLQKALPYLGTAGIIGGAAVAVILLAPAFGTLLFGTLAGLMFMAMLLKEE